MVKKAICFKFIIFVLILFMASVAISMGDINIHLIEEDIVLSSSDLDNIKPNLPLSLKLEDKGSVKRARFKCGGITIKDVNVTLIDDEFVYLGGKPLGIEMKADGLIFSQKMSIITSTGIATPLKDIDVKSGDVLTHVNGIKINDKNSIADILTKSEGNVTLSFLRGNSQFHCNITPAVDSASGQKKLGMWLRDDIQGIGTLTYINPNNMRYGALGHVIRDGESGVIYSKPNGNIYNSTIHKVVKGERGKAGELNGSFNKTTQPLGSIDSNCDFGIFGNYTGGTEGLEKVGLGSKYGVHPGKAYIYTTLQGEKPQKYEIEIIKNTMQNSAKTKGLLLRVTDKRLLESAGGIVQGMSGSPIIQNGKLVGAVTHVFIGDPTKGYGTYVDWMLPN